MAISRLLLSALFLLPGALVASAPVAAQDCTDVVDATVAEVAAGAGEALHGERLALVRRAAGSACVKALSGRYGAVQSSPEQALASEPVVATAAAAPAASPAGEQQTGAEAADEAAEAAGEEKDNALWPFGSIRINDVSASPSRKPYERRRD